MLLAGGANCFIKMKAKKSKLSSLFVMPAQNQRLSCRDMIE